ncbi:hypothetical protein SY88_21080 [Clostridiales bacterium PH28_bin88]|nr:hypothetical protein SY88_21080 [Clostridiales bacterium PH28_bin88]
MTKETPPLTLEWTLRDAPITDWLSAFPASLRELVVKEILKDYILYGEAANPIPTVEVLRKEPQWAPVAATREEENSAGTKPVGPSSTGTSLSFAGDLETAEISKEDADQKLDKVLSGF